MIKIIKNEKEWDQLVESSITHDFYHLYGYHKIAEKNNEGEPIFFVYTHPTNKKFIAIPFLLRPISEIEGLDSIGNNLTNNYFDVTSVYGYSGPLSDAYPDQINDDFIREFNSHLLQFFLNSSIVTAFTRLHPIIENHIYLTLGEQIELGKTVSIDLLIGSDKIYKNYRQNHVRNIKKALKKGVSVYFDKEWKHIAEFLKIYQMTMDKVKASKYYYFDMEYFLSMKKTMGESLKLFVAEYNSIIISAGLFSLTGTIVQYHLGGTLPEYLKLSAFTCIIDAVREFATNQGASVFHLGGGLGSEEDNLFHFKSGFSDKKHQFYIWKYIVNSQVYEQLKQVKDKWNIKNHFKYCSDNYFPIYRSEIKKNF